MQGNCEYEPAIKIVKKGTGKPGAHLIGDSPNRLLQPIRVTVGLEPAGLARCLRGKRKPASGAGPVF